MTGNGDNRDNRDMHACMHAFMHAYMHTCIYAYMHTCIHAYMHIDAYMHTCITSGLGRFALQVWVDLHSRSGSICTPRSRSFVVTPILVSLSM